MEALSSISCHAARPRVRRIAAVAASALLAAASLATVPTSASANGHTIAQPDRAASVHIAQDRRGCVNANTPAVGASNSAMRDAVVCLINQQRAAHGLPALHASRRLDRSARRWTNKMVATQSFTHGSDFSARISAVGFSWQSAGENIATGFPTPQAVVSAWMASPEHCTNILTPTYSDVGTGISRHPISRFGSGPATWTQDFALPMGARGPSGKWGPSRGCPY